MPEQICCHVTALRQGSDSKRLCRSDWVMNRRRLTFVHVARQSRKGKHDYQKIAVFDCHLNSRQRCHPSIAFIRFSYRSVTDTAIFYIATMQKQASTYKAANLILPESFRSVAMTTSIIVCEKAFRENIYFGVGTCFDLSDAAICLQVSFECTFWVFGRCKWNWTRVSSYFRLNFIQTDLVELETQNGDRNETTINLFCHLIPI